MDRRVQKTRAAIREAYFELLKTKKHAHITITDIARTADIDRKTFYLHYESIDAIVHEYVLDRMNDLLDNLLQDNFFEHPFDSSLLYKTLENTYADDIEMFRKIAGTPSCDLFWKEIKKVIIETIEELFTDKVSCSKAELGIHARLFAHGFIGVYQEWLLQEIDYNVDEMILTISEASRYGLSRILKGNLQLHAQPDTMSEEETSEKYATSRDIHDI